MPAKKGSIPWNKGKTKLELPGLARISELRKKRNNFLAWQRANPVHYAVLNKSRELAELYGTLLGDGCLEKFARTEKLTISFNSKEREHIHHTAKIIEKLFGKRPFIRKINGANCVNVGMYQKNLGTRLGFPFGTKSLHSLTIPDWIKNNKQYLIRCLKGLFESDGDWVIDPKYGTNVIKFTNIIETLLDDIHVCLINLGFPANRGKKRVTISRAKEVERFVKLIKFRQY
jgi:intein/homing endonuclease